MRFDPVHAGRVAGVNTQIKRKGTVSMTLNTVQHIQRWLCIALLLSFLSLSSPILAGQDVSQIGGGGYSPPSAGPTYVTYVVRNGDSLTTIAARFGVTPARARQCLSDAKALERLLNVTKRAEGAGINHTPTFLINGKVTDAASWEQLEPQLKAAGG